MAILPDPQTACYLGRYVGYRGESSKVLRTPLPSCETSIRYRSERPPTPHIERAWGRQSIDMAGFMVQEGVRLRHWRVRSKLSIIQTSPLGCPERTHTI